MLEPPTAMPTLRTLCIVNAVVSAPFGIAFLVVPGEVLSLYGAEVEAAGALVARLFGLLLVAVGILTALARDAATSAFGRAVAIAFFVDGAIGAAVLAHGALAGILNTLAWGTVAIYLTYAVAFGYHALRWRASDSSGGSQQR